MVYSFVIMANNLLVAPLGLAMLAGSVGKVPVGSAINVDALVFHDAAFPER